MELNRLPSAIQNDFYMEMECIVVQGNSQQTKMTMRLHIEYLIIFQWNHNLSFASKKSPTSKCQWKQH